MSVQFDAPTCRAFLDDGSVQIGGGLINDWRGWSETQRQEWVSIAAEGGIVPSGFFDPAIQLPPSMVLAPGALCYRILAGENAAASPGSSGVGAEPGSGQQSNPDGFDIDRQYLPANSSLLSRVVEWVRSIFNRIIQAASDALRAVVDTLRTVFESLISGAGGLALWLGFGLAVLLALYVGTRGSKGRGANRAA